jgi:RNA polymerase subunit RPABC4/transcription elongation factor Spt4
MFCIECGKSIPENSKFCPHCGKKQSEGEKRLKEIIAEAIIEEEIHKKVNQKVNTSVYKEFLIKVIAWYSAWILLHLSLLLIGGDKIFGKEFDQFWPFGNSRIKYYDIKEFLVYTIFPAAILVIWGMLLTAEDNRKGK